MNTSNNLIKIANMAQKVPKSRLWSANVTNHKLLNRKLANAHGVGASEDFNRKMVSINVQNANNLCDILNQYEHNRTIGSLFGNDNTTITTQKSKHKRIGSAVQKIKYTPSYLSKFNSQSNSLVNDPTTKTLKNRISSAMPKSNIQAEPFIQQGRIRQNRMCLDSFDETYQFLKSNTAQ